MLTVPGLALFNDSDRTATWATLDFVASSRCIVEHGGADDVAYRLDCAAALGLA